ncbi:hypothetical protein IM793_06255 [Pedobacter sp. MR2016-19]|uniref:hypothetical protein n=1 Tax=Pedobacter sp. MR2016-19 TaxID=2780089 RepID=UPI001875FDBC|nr:hypothetical protein [Pedobacter sp. MR2016-19]MBE5318747.1 hypothetical protein [Pedobacter sp. MR2016-19]
MSNLHQTTPRNTIDKFLGFLFLLAIIVSVIAFFGITISAFVICVKSVISGFDVNYLFKAIEFIFIAPLPILISSVSYSIYHKIIRWYFLDHGIRTPEDANTAREQVLVELSLTKYLFISTLLSTVIVIIIEFLYRRLGELHGKPAAIDWMTLIIGAVGILVLIILIKYVSLMGEHLGHQIKEIKQYRISKMTSKEDVGRRIAEIDVEEANLDAVPDNN